VLPNTRHIWRDIWDIRRYFKIPMFNGEGSMFLRDLCLSWRFWCCRKSSWVPRCVPAVRAADVSKGHSAFIFRINQSKYSDNKSQQDALFLNFILVKNPTCFGQTYCPSTGVLILYSQQLVFVILVMLTVC
jgi:hypothetical protein